MSYTTRTEIPAEVNNHYDRKLLVRALPNLVFTKFAQIRDIPKKAGTKTIKFRRYAALAAATTPLTEGVTPTGSQLSVTDITADVAYYGDYVTFTDVVTIETPDPLLLETAGIFGEQVGDTLDQLVRDVLSATTTIQYASTATSRVTVAAAMKLSATEIREAVRTLQTNKAKKITQIVSPDDGYATSPINAAYIGIVGPKGLYDLKDATGWVPVEKYANKADIMDGEAGALDEVRFILSHNSKVYSGEGAAGIDVHATVLLGANAYGITRISGEALHNIVKPLGSAGAADPLDQRQTSGWKATFVAKILNQSFLLKIEHAVS